MKRFLAGLLLALSLFTPLLIAPTAHAQAFPNKPIRWLVPYPAGGGSDFLARTIGQGLSTQVGQPVVVDNKPGGNTAIAAAETARAPGDGYTVLSADNGTMVFNPALYKSLTYNPVKDLAPVSLMGRFPMILVVAPNVPAHGGRWQRFTSDAWGTFTANLELRSPPGHPTARSPRWSGGRG